VDEFTQILYDQYLAQAYEDQYYNDATARIIQTVTTADAQASYDADPTSYNTYTVSHILLLTVDPSTGASLTDTEIQNAYTRATELQTKIQDGEILGELAAQYSGDTGTKDAGGTFSFTKLSTKTDPYIISWATTAEIGVVSIQQSNSGFHVIRLDKSETTPFETISEQIRSEIAAQKAEEEISAWLDDPAYTLKKNVTALNKISVIR
jgi:foldase protein PrsA